MTMPPAKCDVISKEQRRPFAERKACSGCRKIKSRCIFPDAATSCTRCTRLGIQCTVLSHHRGVKLEQGDHARAASQFNGSSSGSSHMHDETNDGGSDDDSLGSASASTNPFSVQSLLDTTSNHQESASKALLVSTFHSHLSETPAFKVSSSSAKRPLIESVLVAGLFDEDEVADLVRFYYDRLNPIVALLDSHIYTLKALRTNPDYRILLAAICTVAAKFIKVSRYLDSLEFLKPALARIASDDVPPQLEIVQSLSILAMWKHPKDGSSWRKVRLAITHAFELGLHELFAPQRRTKGGPSRSFIQLQRTFMQLSCFEDGYRDQRHLPPAIDPALLPDPREWIDSLGDMVQDMDVRLAASRENANMKRDLIDQLKLSNLKSPNPVQLSRATCLRNARLIKMTITAQISSFETWKNPPASEVPCQHSGLPCLLFHNTNTLFNYYRALYSIYGSPFLAGAAFSEDRQAAFQRCSELSVELFELLNGPYGQSGYYRYVHDIVILNLAVAAVWICDNWRAMPQQLAMQACSAIRQAADATSPTLENHLEQGSYLSRFLRFCCKKLPSTISINENSPMNAEDLVISEDTKWAMGLHPFSQPSPSLASTASGSMMPSSAAFPLSSAMHMHNQYPLYSNPSRSNGTDVTARLSVSGSPSMLSPHSHAQAQHQQQQQQQPAFPMQMGDGSLHFDSSPSNMDAASNGHTGSVYKPANSTVQFLSDSLVPPAYPMNWDTVDDNSIITFLQSISNPS